jgi:hypothetical protein
MNITLDDLARLVRMYGLILCYGSDGARLAFRYHLPRHLRQALRNRRRALARMMLAGDIRLCPAPDLHRRSWMYQGSGRYCCELCRAIDSAQLGMWKQVS